MMNSRFSLGRTLATPGALAALGEAKQSPAEFLARHKAGDWVEMCDEDRQQNELSLQQGSRVFSAYHTVAGARLWVITEADRSSTTILLPSEY